MASEAFAALVSRALQLEVESVEVERVASSPLAEVDRVRWRGPQGSGTLLFKRMRRPASVEAALLPYLARRRVPVPRVIASGIPPARAPESRPWLLLDEVEGVPLRDAATSAHVRTAATLLADLRRATAGDTTLVALGVPRLPPSRIRDEALDVATLLDAELAARVRELASAVDVAAAEAVGESLVHGDFGGENVRVVDRGLAVLEWARAHIGAPVLDIARLARDLGAVGPGLVDETLDVLGVPAATLPSAAALPYLFAIRWEGWLVREGLVGHEELRPRVRNLLSTPDGS